ncbi:hypothetical protein HER39_00100 [Arthrobacter deserti]|uniref:DUF559 domain-containing protein n=1 Tax=Arthrobacter deserti TaxID=1742687 RepID=A0ABX1JIA2_9MICC|nr:hypothetical protein [Arthrobacter deserti]
MTRRGPLPDPFPGTAFSTRSATEAGITAGRLRGQDLASPTRGLRVPARSPVDIAEWLRALQELAPDAVVHRVTAARLLGLPLPPALASARRIELAVPAGRQRPRRPGLECRRLKLAPGDVVNHDGLRVTSLERTFLDLASVLALGDLVAVGDYLVCEHSRPFMAKQTARVPLAALQRYVAGTKGNHGVRRAREAAGLVRVGADSPPETKLRLAVTDLGLPEPVLNWAIRDAGGREVVWPDLAFPDYQVAVQYDGGHHRTGLQSGFDRHRNQATLLHGWSNILIRPEDILAAGYDGAARQVRDALVARGWAPLAPLVWRS